MRGSLFLEGLVLVGVLIVVPTVIYALASLVRGFPRIRLGQVAGIVAVAALVFAVFSVGPAGEGPVIVIGVGVPVIGFFTLWRREFLQLMHRGRDEFPDPLDKVGWFLMLTLAAPAGVWFFRSYRQARWPGTAVGKGATAREASSPWDSDEDEAETAVAAGSRS